HLWLWQCPTAFHTRQATAQRNMKLVPRSNAHAACFSVRCRCFLPQTGAIAQTREPRMVVRRRCLRLIDCGSCLLQFLLNLIEIGEGAPNLLRQSRVLLQEIRSLTPHPLEDRL